MKKIITIILLLSVSSLFGFERGETKELRDFRHSHKELMESTARDSMHYMPAISEEMSRDLMINEDRQLRNRDYRPDERFVETPFSEARRMQKSLQATKPSTHTDKTFSEIADLIFEEAKSANANLSIVEDKLIRHTWLWYKMNDYNKASNLEKQEKIKEISNILK